MDNIKTIISMHEDVKHVEVYEPVYIDERYFPTCFTEDNCDKVPKYHWNNRVGYYEVMDEESYNEAFAGDSSIRYDFEELYGSHDVKILCIMIKKAGKET